MTPKVFQYSNGDWVQESFITPQDPKEMQQSAVYSIDAAVEILLKRQNRMSTIKIKNFPDGAVVLKKINKTWSMYTKASNTAPASEISADTIQATGLLPSLDRDGSRYWFVMGFDKDKKFRMGYVSEDDCAPTDEAVMPWPTRQ